jgi:hypothetical protein
MIATFYIYVDGSELGHIAPKLLARIEAFVEPYEGRVRVVDQRAEDDEASADLQDWDLGVNFEVEALTDAEKKDLVLFFQTLSGEFARDFILGGVLPHGEADELVSITAGESLDGAFEVLLANEKRG